MLEELDYGSAGRAAKKGLKRQQKRHKAQTAQTGVRYNTLRAGESLIVKMAKVQVKKPTKSNKRPKSSTNTSASGGGVELLGLKLIFLQQ
jgi:hypothetical protein